MLFASAEFFLGTLGLALLLLVLRQGKSGRIHYRYGMVLLSIALAAYVYGHDLYKALIFLSISGGALTACRAGLLGKPWAVAVTLMPLVVAKVTSMPMLAMLGLSFASFRAIDVLVYADKNEKIRALDYVAYLFFPLTLLAGPMYRWRAFRDDLQGGFDTIDLDATLRGLETFLLGVIQKFLFADLIERYGLSSLPQGGMSLGDMASTALLYSAFLYFDFAGYSNMAVGLGRMLGLNLPANFNNPIAARNPQDFWRRWHISLSEWLRDVVFMPIYMSLSKTTFFASRRLLAQNIGISATLLIMSTWTGLERYRIVSGVMFASYSVVFNMMLARSKTSPAMAALFQSKAACTAGRILGIILAIAALYVFSGRSPIR
jgi:membrane protein involved in D-alanine export